MPINWGALTFFAMIVGGLALFLYLDRPYEVVGVQPEEARKVVILMHGFGAPGDDLVPAAEAMSEGVPDASFVVLEAPHHRGLGRAWMVGGSHEAVAEQVEESRARVLATVDELVDKGVAPGDIYLGGFSQGAQMALDVGFAVETDHEFGGLILIAGGWPNWPDTVNPRELGDDNLAPSARVLVAHGRSDGVIHFSTGKSVADVVGRRVPSEFVAFDGGHRVSDDARSAVASFLGTAM